MLRMKIDEKSVFVDPSHTFCVSIYHASEGFGLFSDNSHTLCGFLQTYELMRNRLYPSHRLCVSRYVASEGFGLFSDNTYRLCGLCEHMNLTLEHMNLTLVCFRRTLTLCVLRILLVLCDVLRFSRAGIWRFFYFIIESWCPHVYHSVGSLGNRSVCICFCIPHSMCFFISVL